jgi:hypothetical protein
MHTNLLLCELHAHTTWSDGVLTITELVDLYGMHGFDVLCVTDHALAPGDPYLAEYERRGRSYPLVPETYPRYLRAIEREARRAREQYGLLVIPSLELTYNNANPDEAGHALALGLRSYPSLDGSFEESMREARALGAAIVAAHPHGRDPDPNVQRTTRWFWRNRGRLDGLVDRFELFNRHQTFGWVAAAGLSPIASGDFHRYDHLTTWKTLLPCRRDEDAVVAHLRSDRRAYVVPWGLHERMRARLAAA